MLFAEYLLKDLLTYNSGEMLMSGNIFHYVNCSKCGCMKNDVRVPLSHLFLPQICVQISDYNIYCKGCSKARDKETHMIEKGKIFNMSVIQIQLDYFRLNKTLFYADSPTTVKVREMNGLIDYYEDEDTRKNKTTVSYYQCIIPDIYDRHKLYHKTTELQMEEEGYFSYNKRLYEIRLMILNLLWMYVVDMIDDDYHLVDMGSIKRYLNDCVWNSHFD